ncbi:type II toxin-antitoxin system VapC family toxin [Sphingomonas sp. PB4P5]|uniref:type II toxin-antitoxin system VapC family toxin n=1 Tax=Parasphingomonas puruogangriensis TaxID=3096155 RepID=UPI002FC9AF86
MMLDTNVVIDLREEDPRWLDWAMHSIVRARAPVSVSAIVVGELAIRGGTERDILAMLAGIGLGVTMFDARASHRAGAAQYAYRAAGGGRDKLLGDFLIGAHAETAGQPLLTRDPRHYRSYFPDLTLITPETDA